MKNLKIFLLIFFTMFIGISTNRVKAVEACFLCTNASTGDANLQWSDGNPAPSGSPNVTTTCVQTSKSKSQCSGTSACYTCSGPGLPNYQWTVINPDEKNCKIDTSKNRASCVEAESGVDGVCYYCDSGDDVGYHWSDTNPSRSNCRKVDRSKSECATLSKSACYVCGGSNNSSYYWGTKNPNPNRCVLDKLKSEAGCKGSSNENGTSDNTGEYLPPKEVDNSDKQEADIEPISYVSCGSIDDVPEALPRFVRNIVNLLKIIIPVLIIFLGMLDLVRTITFTGDPKDPPFKKFFRRLITGVLAFFIIALVQFVFGSVKDSDGNLLGCISCFVSSENSCTPSDYQSPSN